MFVTHFLEQVYEISDRITILRNGEFIGEYMAKDLTRIELVSKMIGKELHMLEELPKSRSGAYEDTGKCCSKRLSLGRKGAIEPLDLHDSQGGSRWS